ncbi:VanZ family protein [Arthrobacter sp. H20]|uniref:VanZ family protein n=1 Tax=Arthrobacter sp. H20 TaxID=1267981 RepID=UPI00068531E7|nr:VanZ family protein [Arthrobacter sp. H20]
MAAAPLPSRRYRAITAALCATWLACVALVVFNRTPVDSAAADFLQRGLRLLHTYGLPTFVDYGVVEFAANSVMLVPFGLFWFILAARGWRWLGPLVGVGLSIVIEIAQLTLLPERFASPYDVLANGAGALVGTLVAWRALRSREKAQQRFP